jgi:hypothetical protein
MAKKTTTKTKPPNTLLSSQTTPHRPRNKTAALGRLLALRTTKEHHRSGTSLWDIAALYGLAVSRRRD